MSSLQVDSISSMGGGHVVGAGLVVQFKEAVNTTAVDIAEGVTATILTINFTPKFSDSLILCQAFHSQDLALAADSSSTSRIFAGSTEVGSADLVGYRITKISRARFNYSYSGSRASWGAASLAIDLRVKADVGSWTVSEDGTKTSLLVWEIAQ